MNEFGSPAPLTPAMPAALPFAPFTFSQILDRIFRLLRENIRLFFGVASLPFAFLFLTIGAMEAFIFLPLIRHPHSQPNPEIIFSHFLPMFLVITVLSAAIYAFYFAAASHAATSADQGIRITIIQAYRLTWQHMGRYTWLLLLMYLLAILPILLIMLTLFLVPGLMTHGVSIPILSRFLIFPLFVLLVVGSYVYAIVIMMRLALAFPACVVEGLTAREAIRRSGQLTRRAKGRIFLVLLVIFAVCYALMLVSALAVFALIMLGAFAMQAIHVSLQPPWSYLGFGLIGVVWLGLMFLWVTLPWASSMTALAVLYRDQRLLNDGYSAIVQP